MAKKPAVKKAREEKDDHGKSQAKAQLESIIEMTDALANAGDDAREEAEQTIHEDALSVQVRSGWANVGDALNAEEFNILLCTGGPACRIIGTLNGDNQPETVKLQYQDWGTPWTDYRLTHEEEQAVIHYSSCFFFGE